MLRLEPAGGGELGPECPSCTSRGMIRLQTRIFGCQRCKQVSLLTVGAGGLKMVELLPKRSEIDELQRRLKPITSE